MIVSDFCSNRMYGYAKTFFIKSSLWFENIYFYNPNFGILVYAQNYPLTLKDEYW